MTAWERDLGDLFADIETLSRWGHDMTLPPFWATLSSAVASAEAGTQPAGGVNSSAAHHSGPPDARRAIRGTSQGGTELVVEVFHEQPGVPLGIGELHEALSQRGWTTGALKPRNLVANLVNKAIRRDPRITKVEGRRGVYVWHPEVETS